MRNSSSLDWLRFMHTPNDYRVSPFLAWQEEPGVSMGSAIAKSYLRADSEQAILFVNWLKNLFS